MSKKYNRPDFKQKLALAKMIEENCDNGTANLKDPELLKLAKRVYPETPMTLAVIKGIRSDLDIKPKQTSPTTVTKRYDQFEIRLDAIEKWITSVDENWRKDLDED